MSGEDPLHSRLFAELVVLLGTILVTGFMTSLTRAAIEATPFVELLHVGIGLGVVVGLLGVSLLFRTSYAEWTGPAIVTNPLVHKGVVAVSLVVIVLFFIHTVIQLTISIDRFLHYSQQLMLFLMISSMFSWFSYEIIASDDDDNDGNSVSSKWGLIAVGWIILTVVGLVVSWAPVSEWELQYLDGVVELLGMLFKMILVLLSILVIPALLLMTGGYIYLILSELFGSESDE